jgi:hypothetical protein
MAAKPTLTSALLDLDAAAAEVLSLIKNSSGIIGAAEHARNNALEIAVVDLRTALRNS